MGLDEYFRDATVTGMENDLTPEIVRSAATRAHLRLAQFLRRADVSTSAFYRWAEGKKIDAVNQRKLSDAVTSLDQERAA